MSAARWVVNQGVLMHCRDNGHFIPSEESYLLESFKEALESGGSPGHAGQEPAALACLVRDSSSGSLDLMKKIVLGSFGSARAAALFNILREVAQKGNSAPLYQCWLVTGLPRLAAELAEGGWIPAFASHVHVLENLELGDADAILHIGSNAVPPLINAALILDAGLGPRAVGCLQSLSDQAAIDCLCAVWFESRILMLADIIKSRRYVASSPVGVRVASALLNGDLCVASDVDATGVSHLLALLNDTDKAIADAAFHALLMLRDTVSVNALLSVWACQRTTQLDQIVADAGYVATEPLPVKVLSALRTDRFDLLTEKRSSLIHPLLMALSDGDGRIANRAFELLQEMLNDREASESFCTLAMRLDIPRALDIAVQRRLFPQSLRDRALFFFLTEQWAEYEKCDFDLSILRQWFEHGGRELRVRIAQTARRAGRLELVELVSGVRHRRKMGAMTAREWNTALSILREQRNWETMWRMAVSAPAVWAVAALRELQGQGWLPADADQQTGFSKMAAYAHECKGEPPTVCMDERPAYQFTAHTRRVSTLVVSSYFHHSLATGSWDGGVGVWDMRDGSMTKSFQAYAHPVAAVAATPDGTSLFAGSGAHSTVVGRDMPEAVPAINLGGHSKGVACLAPSPDGRLLAAGGYDNLIYLWRLRDRSLIGLLRGHCDSIRSLVFSPDGTLLASGSEDGDVGLWEIPGGRLVHVFKGHALTVRSVCFNPDGNFLVTGSSDNTLIIWDLSDFGVRNMLQGHNNVVSAVAVSGDGRVIASAGWDKQIILWEFETGKCLGFLRGHTGPITCLASDPESRALVSGGHDSQVIVWNFQSGIFRRSTKRDEMERVETLLSECTDEAARPWLQFLLAQMRWRWRFDIQIADGHPSIEIGEFDIEIEG